MRKAFTRLWLFIICGLLLTGCGLAGAGQPPGNVPETTTVRETFGENVAPVADHRTAEEILEQLIGDEGFRARVRNAAGIEEADTEELILQKLEQCEELTLKSEAVCSLEDLRLLPNLQGLVIDDDTWKNDQIEDFTPIAGLSRLKTLYISYPTGENLDFSFLAEMETITELFLVDCDLKDASFLGEMPQLQCLSLYQTPVADLAVFQNLTELVELALYGNGEAEHIEAVGRLSKLRDLGLQDCGIRDISFLSSLTELRGVNLNYNSVTDLTPLAGLSGLERLGLVENEVSDLSPLAGLENLFDLALDGNRICDISALANLPRLNQAGLSGNQIQDFSPLADKPELLYASVLGNPCSDLEPLLLVPLLNFENGNVSEEQQRVVADWLKEQRPDVEEYECIDCVEADLDGDGLSDIAFVVDGEFMDGDDTDPYTSNNLRRMFILLRQGDNSFKEVDSAAVHMSSPYSGGMRGDPYRGIWIGDGYVLVRQGWGSSEGSTETEIYCYQNGSLELLWYISISDCFWSDGYAVTVDSGKEENTYVHYAIAMDGHRLVRVDLYTDECPSDILFPETDLYSVSYYAYPEKLPTCMSGVEALEYLRDTLEGDWEQVRLPYVSWQKESYELLKGVELPDYYYVIRDISEDGGQEPEKFLKRLYYLDMKVRSGEYYHMIRYIGDDGAWNYRIKDFNGEIEVTNEW